MEHSKEIAECVGLWLAEGDNKCKNEITFTNNCMDLIKHFDKTLRLILNKYNLNIRIYVYSSKKENIEIPIKNCKINRYIDKRARKPYMIWRLCSVKLYKIWRKIVEELKKDEKYYPDILRGFFAGEGNIKTNKISNVRVIRIAQGKPNKFTEELLNKLKIEYSYYQGERAYSIFRRVNWDKCAKINIADLHPEKRLKFWKTYKDYRQYHYKHNYLKDKLQELNKPTTSQELALKFKRDQSRISEILTVLKRLRKIKNFRVRSKDYWIREDQDTIIISSIKDNYLKYLKNSEKTTKEISKNFNVTPLSSFKILKKLRDFGLVTRNENKKWNIKTTRKKVIVI